MCCIFIYMLQHIPVNNDNLIDLIFELYCSQPQLTGANESLCPYCLLSAWTVFFDMLCHSWFGVYLIVDVLSHRAGVCWGHGDKCPDSSSVVLFSGRTATNCSVNNGDCDHECHEKDDDLGRTCSCIKGYQLQDNSRKCTAKSKLPQQMHKYKLYRHWWFCIRSAQMNA